MKEIRTAEIRASDLQEENKLILEGVPIVFDTPTIINDKFGSYKEIIKSGALSDISFDDTTLLYNHDLSKVPLARSPKTMQLFVEDNGVKMIANLANTENAKEIYAAVKRGDLSGMSFAFKVPKGGDYFDPNTNTRTINKIEKIYEVSILPFPAYPQTSVEARTAMQGTRSKQKNINQLKIKINQILKRSV